MATGSQPARDIDASSTASSSASSSTDGSAPSNLSPLLVPSPPVPDFRLIKKTICEVTRYSAPVKIHIRIIAVDSREIVRRAGLEFHSELTDFQGLNRRTSNARLSVVEDTATGTKKHYLHFEYLNRVLFGTSNVPSEWPQHIKDELQKLASHPRDGKFTLEMPYDPTTRPETVTTLLESLNSVRPNNFFPNLVYVPPAGTSKFIETWDELSWAYGRERKLSVDSGQVAAPAVYCFGSPEEARLRLIHGRYADYLWEKKRSDEISNCNFEAAFVKTKSDTILAFVKMTDKGALPRMNDKMALEICFNAWGYRKADNKKQIKAFSAIGQLTINEFDIEFGITPSSEQEINTMVLLLRRVSVRMRQKAVDISKIGSTGKELQFMPVDIKVKDYYQALLQFQAINTFFKSPKSLYRNFWSGFMGVDSPELKLGNFLTEKRGITKQQIDAVVAGVRQKMTASGMILNPEQDKILSRLGETYGGWRLIRGPPGTGKSTLIAILACALLQFSGTGVLLVAPSNGAASKLFGSLNAVQDILKISDPACKPLRLFRKYYELDHFDTYFDRRGSAKDCNLNRRMDDEAANILEDEMSDWYSRQLEAEDRRLVDDPSNGLMAAVIQAFEDEKLPVAAGEQSQVPCSEIKRVRQKEHYVTAKEALAKLKLFKGEKPSCWDMRKLALDVATQIIGTRRVVVSTADNVTSLMAREGIFRDCKSWSCMFDEQTLATEASTLSVAAGTIKWQRIMDEFGGRNPLDSILLVGDEKQGTPLVQSQQDEANLFGPQMELPTFERLVKVGVPVETLLEQHRMVPCLREFPSQRCYGDRLRDSVEAQSRLLCAHERQALKRLLKKPAFNSEVIAANENRDLRHLLLDVPDAAEEKERHTASRRNKSNVAVALDLVKYLVLERLVTPREIVILTFYNAQKKEYLRALSNLEVEVGLKNGDFDDCVETCDSFQGRERKCVILDFVVTSYSKKTQMGNVSNDRKMNVGCTRARDFFFVVARADILLSENIPAGRLEYGLELLRRLKNRKALVDIPILQALAKAALARTKSKK